jgi:hypothetical protein
MGINYFWEVKLKNVGKLLLKMWEAWGVGQGAWSVQQD